MTAPAEERFNNYKPLLRKYAETWMTLLKRPEIPCTSCSDRSGLLRNILLFTAPKRGSKQIYYERTISGKNLAGSRFNPV